MNPSEKLSIKVNISIDDDGFLWQARSDDIPELKYNFESLDSLIHTLRVEIPEMLKKKDETLGLNFIINYTMDVNFEPLDEY
jgi:hypothetical protein